MSLWRSNATTSAGNLPPDCSSTTVSLCPATTWAAVTIRSAFATQPVPSTPIPQAIPSTRTTLGAARRTPTACARLGSGGATDAAGPVIAGKGSMRASAFSTSVGGMNLFSLCSRAEPWAPRRRSVCPGSNSATAPSTHTTATPGESPEDQPAGCVEGAQLPLAHPRAERRPRQGPERLEQDRADSGAGQSRQRRVRRVSSVLKELRRKPRSQPAPQDDPGQGQGARNEPLLPADEAREGDETERDQVNFGH